MPEQRKSTAAAWKKAKRHTVTLPSGVSVEIELPNIQFLLKTGQIPNSLVQIVTKAATDSSFRVTPEMLAEQWDYTSFLVAKTVVEPAVTVEEVAELPSEDVEMIVDFALRNRDLDALGHHLSGLETQESFRRFRGLDIGDTGVSGL